MSGLYDLAAYARAKIKKMGEGREKDREDWKERLKDLGFRVGNAFIEAGDLDAARRHFIHLRSHTTDPKEKESLGMWIVMLLLKMGDVPAAESLVAELTEIAGNVTEEDVKETEDDEQEAQITNADLLNPLISMSRDDFSTAATQWQRLLHLPHPQNPYQHLAQQNLAICLLYLGHVDEVCAPFSRSPYLVKTRKLTSTVRILTHRSSNEGPCYRSPHNVQFSNCVRVEE